MSSIIVIDDRNVPRSRTPYTIRCLCLPLLKALVTYGYSRIYETAFTQDLSLFTPYKSRNTVLFWGENVSKVRNQTHHQRLSAPRLVRKANGPFQPVSAATFKSTAFVSFEKTREAITSYLARARARAATLSLHLNLQRGIVLIINLHEKKDI